jgi:hypothetical protein
LKSRNVDDKLFDLKKNNGVKDMSYAFVFKEKDEVEDKSFAT